MINSLDNSFGIAGGFALLQRLQEVQEEAAKPDPQAVVEPAAVSELPRTSSSSNPMSGNFYNAAHEQSKYVQSSLEGKRQESAYANKMTSVVTSLISQASLWDQNRHFGDKNHPIENTYVIGNRLTTASSKVMRQVQEEETAKESKKNLDEIKEDIEQRADKATAPADENGKPIEAAPSEDAEKEAAPPVPETSASTEAPASSSETVTAVPPEVPEGMDAATAESTVADAPQFRLIDIKV